MGGIREVSPRIWGYGNIGNTLIVVVGVDLRSPRINFTSAYPLAEGSFLTAQENNTVVIGKAVADMLGTKVGETLSILSESNQVHQYVVKGIFDTESSIYNADMIIMSLNGARSFFGVPADQVTDITVYINNVDKANYQSLQNYVAREISGQPNVRVLTKDVLLKAQQTTYDSRAGFFSVVWYVLLIAVAIIAFNQTVVVGHESKFEVGLLKALGFSTTDVIKVRLLESTILGVIAGTIGLTVGILYDVIFKSSSPQRLRIGMGYPLPELHRSRLHKRPNCTPNICHHNCPPTICNSNTVMAQRNS
jgi:ABC-type lipoprotein release transport system permease subunit